MSKVSGHWSGTKKKCFVPGCPNNSEVTPDKLFLSVPRNLERRLAWFMAIGVDCFSPQAPYKCCQDHFNIEEDVANWLEVRFKKDFGMSQRLYLRPGVIPRVSGCQPDKDANSTAAKKPKINIVFPKIFKDKPSFDRDEYIKQVLKTVSKPQEGTPQKDCCAFKQDKGVSLVDEDALNLKPDKVKLEPGLILNDYDETGNYFTAPHSEASQQTPLAIFLKEDPDFAERNDSSEAGSYPSADEPALGLHGEVAIKEEITEELMVMESSDPFADAGCWSLPAAVSMMNHPQDNLISESETGHKFEENSKEAYFIKKEPPELDSVENNDETIVKETCENTEAIRVNIHSTPTTVAETYNVVSGSDKDLLTHSDENSFFCVQCSHRSKTEDDLQFHIVLTHSESRGSRFIPNILKSKRLAKEPIAKETGFKVMLGEVLSKIRSSS